MSTSGISTSLLSQIAGSPSTANQFATDLNQLAKDLQSGNLSSAQDDFVTLSQDALNGVTSSSATTSSSGITTSLLSEVASSSSSGSFVSQLNQLGTDLQNGDLSDAQGDMLQLDSTALNAVPAANSSSSPASSSSTTIATTNQAESTELIQAIVQAMADGDDSAVSTGMSQLASISPSAQGASVLEQESQNFGSGSTGSSASSSVSQLLDQMNASSSSTGSLLSTLA